MKVQGTAIGAGSITPGPRVLGGQTGWRWRGKPAGWPADPATHEPVSRPVPFAESSAERKRRRLAEYEQLAAVRPRLSQSEIARRMGVARKTVASYAREVDSQVIGGEEAAS